MVNTISFKPCVRLDVDMAVLLWPLVYTIVGVPPFMVYEISMISAPCLGMRCSL